MTSSTLRRCISLTALEDSFGSSSGDWALLMWIWSRLSTQEDDGGRGYLQSVSARPRITHHRDVKFVQVSPRLGFGLDDVDFLESKGPLVPNIREHRSCLGAQSTILAREEGYPTGLEQPGGYAHGVRV